MGNNIKPLFKSKELSDKTQSNEKIPYSYTPNSEDDDNNDNDNNIDDNDDFNKPKKEIKKIKLKCVRIIKGHHKWCNCLIKLKSNNLCSCSGDKSINVYSNDNNFNVILTIPSSHDDFILYVLEVFNFVIVSCSSDGNMKIWKIVLNSNIQNENNYYLLKTIKAHLLDVWKALFIEERNQIVSCGSDSLIKVWDISMIKNDKIDDNQNIDINNYSNSNLNSTKEKKDIINVELNKEIKAHKYWILTMIQAKNNKKNVNYLISNSGDSTIKFFDINQNYNLKHSMNNHICCKPGAMTNYNDEKFLIGGPRGTFFYIINFLNFQIEAKIYEGVDEIATILVLKKNNFIHNGGFLIGGKQKCFYYFSEYSYEWKGIKSNAHKDFIYCLIQLNDNLLASSSYGNDIKIWKYSE